MLHTKMFKTMDTRSTFNKEVMTNNGYMHDVNGNIVINNDIVIYPLTPSTLGKLNRFDNFFQDDFYPYALSLFRENIEPLAFKKRGNVMYGDIAFFATMHIIRANANKIADTILKSRTTMLHYYDKYNELRVFDRQHFTDVLDNVAKFIYMLDYHKYLVEDKQIEFPSNLLQLKSYSNERCIY